MLEIADSEEVRAFSYWLRTGRRLKNHQSGKLEVKFNPWHDPHNGQFTFANSGDYHPFRGGGGSNGGGGASGAWQGPKLPSPSKRSLPRPILRGSSTPSQSAPEKLSAGIGVIAPPRRFKHVNRNGYDFEIDPMGQMRRASGTLTIGTQPRNRRAQRAAGGISRRPTDDGGHYIATRFNGPPDDFNLFPQDANFNRGRYRLLEDEWAKAKRAGKKVKIVIVPGFETGSTRPYQLDVTFWIDGQRRSVKFQNEKQEKPRGKR